MCKLALIVYVVLSIPAQAWSQDEASQAKAKTQAQALLKQGNSELDKGRFESALEKFQAAYLAFPSPKLFMNQGNAYWGLKRNLAAFSAYQRFLAEAKDAPLELQIEAKKRMEALSGRLARVQIQSNRPAALVWIGPQKQGETPLPEPIVTEPGEQQVALEWQGERKAQTVKAIAGELTQVSVEFPIKPALLRLRCNREGASVRVNGKFTGNTPFTEPLGLLPGANQVALEWGGQAKTLDLTLLEGQERSEQLDFSDLVDSPSPTTIPERPWHKRTWPWVVTGAVVGTVATTLVLVYGRSDRYPGANLGTQAIGN